MGVQSLNDLADDGVLNTTNQPKSNDFQGFQKLEEAVMNFKYFQALQGPVRTMPV